MITFKTGEFKADVEIVRINGSICIKVNGGLFPTKSLTIGTDSPDSYPIVKCEFYPTDFIGLPDQGES